MEAESGQCTDEMADDRLQCCAMVYHIFFTALYTVMKTTHLVFIPVQDNAMILWSMYCSFHNWNPQKKSEIKHVLLQYIKCGAPNLSSYC